MTILWCLEADLFSKTSL